MKISGIFEKIVNIYIITVIGENIQKIEEKINREYEPVGALTEANRGFSLDNNPAFNCQEL